MFTLRFSLFGIHSCLNYINNIVAKLLTFLDEIHVHRADSVGIGMSIDIINVLCSQLIAIVVDFILDVE